MKQVKDNVWIFTFEYAGIIKVGGLGEVPANQAKNLSTNFDITVFIPSHGQLSRLEKNSVWEKLKFNCVGQIDPLILGLNESITNYNISFYKSKIDNVNIILLKGENDFTSRFLDDTAVYNPDTLNGKICLFSIGMRCFIDYLIDHHKDILPDIIHLHDYHSVIPFIGIKQEMIKNGLDFHSIITIHLLTWPRHAIDFYYACGVDQTPIMILFEDGYKSLTIDEIFTLSRTSNDYSNINQAPTVEKIGAVICDLVTTVSQSYLISDVIPNCGNQLIEFKSDFIWDGCDWDYDEISMEVLRKHGEDIHKI
ncbi:MAG: glycogen/starch synthase, partial [Promethearchaeota archaeon]